ncbi:MAG: hypothetical protein GYA55_14920 [SAR324 cluster bacterium]|uniref:Flagellin n=1 Tax=SAR324 cluster bacterium TaxID=2024889 RepID=A0A7X9IMU5_9DELT|nr:hypothetical protein [SAR324 cluster bacterium]
MSINSSSSGGIRRILDDTSNKLVKSSERLSSGLRINSASDDAAGLAIAASLGTEAAIGRKGIDNASYAQSALDIADAAVGQVKNIADRLNELAQQSANGTLSNEQRSSLQDEFSQLTQEIDRIAQTTQFNGVNLLQGVSIPVPVSDASNPNNIINIPAIEVSSNPLSGHNVSTQESAKAAMAAISSLRDNLNEATSSIGSIEKRLESATSTEKVAVENRLSAASRIRDVDYASEVAEHTKLSILQDSSTAMMAHSKQQESMVLQLLK